LPTVNDTPAGYPSSSQISLTLNSSGSSYIAPANGWIFLEMNSSAHGQSAYINSITHFNGTYYSGYAPFDGKYGFSIIYPCVKNEEFIVVYSFTELAAFKFFYDEGTPTIIKY